MDEDLHSLRMAIEQLRADVDAKIRDAELRTEFREGIAALVAELRADFHQEFGDLRTEMRNGFAYLRKEMNTNLRWLIGVQITTMLAALGAVARMTHFI